MAWVPDSAVFYTNLIRPKTYLTFVMSFGVTGLLAVLLLRRENIFASKKKYISYYLGILLSIALFVYAMLTAYSDGRFMWPAIPFGVVLSMYMLESSYNNRWNNRRLGQESAALAKWICLGFLFIYTFIYIKEKRSIIISLQKIKSKHSVHKN